MLNAGAVLAINEWKQMIRLQKEERRQVHTIPLYKRHRTQRESA